MGRPTHSILNYIILGWTTLDSRALRPHFVGSLHYIDQHSGFKPQNLLWGDPLPNMRLIVSPSLKGLL